MTKKLVIVESPAKARTLAKIMGTSYTIKASMGHVRDLPTKILGIDVNNGFEPRYAVLPNKKAVVKEIMQAAGSASEVYLATDPDREGEAISWHLVHAANLENATVHRVVFHEITDEAIKAAFQHPRKIDMNLVNAQQARRILDRLVGYKISPLLWKKVQRGLSAGRVQSVALRMIVEREQQILNFVPQEYWTIDAQLAKASPDAKAPTFKARLAAIKGERRKLQLHNENESKRIASDLKDSRLFVSQIKKKRLTRTPPPPFITSTLQQEAWRKLRFTGQRTMAVAQQLYEGLSIGEEGEAGLITYMRTDSTRVAESAVAEARDYINQKFGSEFLPPHARQFTRKAKGAQEAHEAVRPTRMWREPDVVKPHLNSEQARLYRLIWERMIASQLANALFDTTSIDIEATAADEGTTYILKAAGSVPHFLGFLVLYSEGKDDSDSEDQEGKARLPALTEGEKLRLLELLTEQHFTEPPPRYNEATLVKTLEENGIGRPSTYAPIIATLRRRGYVQAKEGRFYPLDLGTTVNGVLVAHFPTIVDTGFTAKMEEELDEIGRGKQDWVSVVREFYVPFEETLRKASVEMVRLKEPDEPTDQTCPNCSKPMVIRSGRFGKFLACTGYPKCKTTANLGDKPDRPRDARKGRRKAWGKKRVARSSKKPRKT
jgi:DNA topoisomerase-1